MKKFEVGKDYYFFYMCSDTPYVVRVESRTDKSVVIRANYQEEGQRRRIKVVNGVETILPEGSYSNAPTLSASEEWLGNDWFHKRYGY